VPVISVRFGKGRSIETKRVAAQMIADAVVASLDVKREWVTILFDEYDRENWATGGELHLDKFGARLGASVTKLLFIGTFRLPTGSLDRARAAMREMIMGSRAEEGCVEYSYSEDVAAPGLIHVKEIRESREALAAHLQSDHLKKWRPTWQTLQISDRDLAVYELGYPESI
jgi:4-oxalocrotonate tautomerase family enzyme